MSAVAPLSHDQLIARANDVLPTIAGHADQSELARSVDPHSIDAVRDAGLFGLLVPRRAGGHECDLATMVEAIRLVSTACSATGWVLMVCTAHDWLVGMFSEQAQDEVYATGPDALVAGTLAPQGSIRRVDGGWRVSGRWQFGSGGDHAPWCLLGTKETEASNEKYPQLVHVLVPREDFVLDDTWHVLGLRGTGSKDVVVEDAFVPDHRSMPTGTLLGNRSKAAGRHRTTVYRTPVMPGLGLHLAAAVLGIAAPALDGFVAATRGRADVYTGAGKIDSVGLQLRIAESTAELRTAELLVHDTRARLDAAAASDEPAGRELRAECKYHAAYAVELCRRAIERVFAAAGAHATHDSNPLQKAHRDLNTACHHATVDLDSVGEAFGKLRLGLSSGTHPL